jgi:hypothetical protein
MPLQNLDRGTHARAGEVLDWTYYDSFAVSAALSVNMFQQAVGQGSTPKTLDQTNMTSNGQIPTGQRMTIHRIKLNYISQATTWASAGTAQTLYFYTMLAKTTLEFRIPGKDSLLTITLAELLGAATLLQMVPTTAGNADATIQPRFHGILPLNKPIILAAQTTFGVLVTHQTAPNAALYTGAGDIVKIGLNGILERRS